MESRRPTRVMALRHGLIIAGLIFTAYILIVAAPAKGTLAVDAFAYWNIDLAHPYQGEYGEFGFFPYSPPIALVMAPLGVLPLQAFLVLWYAILIAALIWLGGRSTLAVLAFPPVAINLSDGNIHLLLAVAIALGFRFPAAWSFVLLTKVTPGIGLLWFAARREWRSFGIALGATGAIVAASLVLLPGQWAEWVQMLAANASQQPPAPAIPVPLWVRLPIAAVIVAWGAVRDKRWTVLLAAALAEPALWPASFAILAGWRRVTGWPDSAGTSRRRQSRRYRSTCSAPTAP